MSGIHQANARPRLAGRILRGAKDTVRPGGTMGSEAIETYRTFMKAVAGGDIQGALARVDPEAYTEQCVGFTAGWIVGFMPALESFMARVAPNLPPIAQEEIEVVALGDRVVARMTVTARHTGPIFGYAATQRNITYTAVDMVRIVGGRIVWRYLIPDIEAILVAVGGPTMLGAPSAKVPS
jgi:predicted ester cyclase